MNNKAFLFASLKLVMLATLVTLVGCSNNLSKSSKLNSEQRIAEAANYLKLARESQPPLSVHYRLQATEQLILVGQTHSASRILREVLSIEEDPNVHKQILQIRLSLLKEDTKHALTLLKSLMTSMGIEPENTLRVGSGNGKRIALLLPLQGSFSDSAKTIRDGFLAAYYKNLQNKSLDPTIQVYDTGDGSAVLEAYQKAIAEQSDIIVGPLTKSEVEIIASINLDIPVLALNTMSEQRSLPGQLYQFGLLPEDEVFAAVRHARNKGYQRAVIMVPKGEWGQRMTKAFTHYWEKQGGTLIGLQSFIPGHNLDASVRKLLSTEGNSENPGNQRRDIDMIFMPTTPDNARQIKPLLDQYHADNIPVYSTSTVYSGTPTASKDQNLNGIIFCDMPWILQADQFQEAKRTAAKSWSSSYSYSPRYFALGMDAYQLASELSHSRALKTVTGVTGTLILNRQQHVKRQLVCAKFVQGVPVPY